MDEDIAIGCIGEGVEHEVECIVEAHHETCHCRVGDSDWLALQNLIDHKRNNGATGGHDVSVAGTAYDSL